MIYKDNLIPSLSKSTETYHRKDWGAGTLTGICVLSPPDTLLSQFMGQYYFTYRRVRGIGVVSHCLLPGCYHYTSSASNGQTVSGEFCMVLPHHFSEFTEMEYRWGWFTAARIAEKGSTHYIYTCVYMGPALGPAARPPPPPQWYGSKTYILATFSWNYYYYYYDVKTHIVNPPPPLPQGGRGVIF